MRKTAKMYFVGCLAAILGAVLAAGAAAGTLVYPVGGRFMSAHPLPELELMFRHITAPGTISAERVIATDARMPFWDFGWPQMLYDVNVTVSYEDGVLACVDSFSLGDRFDLPRQRLMIAGRDGDGRWHVLPRASTPDSRIICGEIFALGDVAVVQPFGLKPVTVSRESAIRQEQDIAAASTVANAEPHTQRISFFSGDGEALLTAKSGSAHPVTGARIRLNGVMVMNGSAFKYYGSSATTPVALAPGENVLEVTIDGGPASSLTVSICGLSSCAE